MRFASGQHLPHIRSSRPPPAGGRGRSGNDKGQGNSNGFLKERKALA